MGNNKALQLFNKEHEKYCLETLQQLTLNSLSATKLYSCFYDKKIWNNSTFETYENQHYYTSFDEAAAFAETLRARGRTVYIKEQPAIAIQSKDFSIAVTQLNEHCPFTSYSAQAIHDHASEGFIRIEKFSNNYMALTAPILGILLSFELSSRFWKTPLTKEQAVIALYADNSTSFAALKTTKLKAWSSKSAGKNNPLGWNEENNNISQSAILRHIKQSQEALFTPVKASSKSQDKTQEARLKAIREQVLNDLFFFYRENDLGNCLGNPSKFWVESHHRQHNQDLLFTQSPKKGLKCFRLKQTPV